VFLEFEGISNARDLGGIPAAGGGSVAVGRLIRSGHLAAMTVDDARALIDELGVRTVIDMRTDDEAAAKPDCVGLLPGVELVRIPIFDIAQFGVTHEGGKLRGAWKLIRTVKKHPERILMDVYSKMVLDEESRSGFRRFFEALLSRGDGAVLWHCSSGKDRAGVATALLLAALGADRDAIMADYLASNGHMGNAGEGVRNTLAAYHLEERLADSIRVLSSADERFLDAAFDAIGREFGGIDRYLADALGLGETERARLCELYLS
jgi:protein-tyrosine phosphatase